MMFSHLVAEAATFHVARQSWSAAVLVVQVVLELTNLRKHSPRIAATRQALARLCMDKKALRHWLNSLFEKLSIQGVPIGAEALQAKMAQADLTSNELSQGIVSAREG